MSQLKQRFKPPALVNLLSGVVGVALLVQAAPGVITEPRRIFGLGDLYFAAVSPNGRHLATAGPSGAFLWDLDHGTVRHHLAAHRGRVSALCFSPDNQTLLTGGFDRTIRIWDLETGDEIRSITGHQGDVVDLAFAPDGQSIVSAGDNTARIWSLATGEIQKSVIIPGTPVMRALFTPDGSRLVTADGSPTNNVRLWDLATGETVRSFGDLVHQMGFVAGGQLITGGQNTAVQVWNLETGQVIRSLDGATQMVLDLLASKDSSLVIAGCLDGRLIAWDSGSGQVVHNFLDKPIRSLVNLPDPNRVLLAGSDNVVRIKNLETGSTLRSLEGHTTSTTTAVGFSPDGRYVLSGGVEAVVRIWNRTNAESVRTLPVHPAGTMAGSFSPDGARILTTSGAPQHVAQVWNTETGQLEREFPGHTSWLLAAEFSPDGRRIATGAQDGTARLWDVATGQQLRTFTSPGQWIRSVAVSSNGMYLASGASDGAARLWNATNGQLLHTFQLNAGSVIALAFSPATGDLLVGWEDGLIRLFDPVTGESNLDVIAPAAFLDAAVFSPDGRFVLGGEGWPYFTARLWDARTGEVLRVFAGHNGPVDSVAFNASGTQILTGADRVRLWSIADVAARLEMVPVTNGLELQWKSGVLQHSGSLGSPWQEVTDATSPWTISTDQSASFFRVVTTDVE